MASKKKGESGTVQASRVGKEQQTVWLEPEVKRQLKILAAELGTTMEELHVAQIKALLRKHGKLK